MKLTFSKLEECMDVIYPSFYTQQNYDGATLVFLKFHNAKPNTEALHVEDKTQCEAVSNHFHIFDRVNKKYVPSITSICIKIAENMLSALKNTFPDKKFVVLLSINPGDSTIIRFHQIWENEPLYYDLDYPYPGTTVYAFFSHETENHS